MSIHYYEIELDCFLDRFFATVEIEFEFVESDKMVRYYRNGDGYPGSDAAVYILSVRVTSLSNDSWDKTLEELEESGFAKWLNEEAAGVVQDEVLGGGWLLDTLLEEANYEPED